MVRLFRHYVPRSLFLLAVIEFVLFVTSIYIGVELRFLGADSPSRQEIDPLFPKSILFAFVMLGSTTAMGLYWRHFRDGTMWMMIIRIVGSFAISLTVLSLFFYALPLFFVGRGALSIALLFSFVGLLVARLVHYAFSDHESLKKRVLVLGAGKSAHRIEQSLRRKVDRKGLHLVGYVHVKGEKDAVDDHKILHAEQIFDEIVDPQQVDEIVIAIEDRRKNFPVDEVLKCKVNGIEIVDLITFFERQTGKIRIDALHPSTLIFSDGFSQALIKNISKRVFDVTVSLFLLALAWPLMLFTALAVYVESKGKGTILYRQIRVGKDGRYFEILKFRSMRQDAEQEGRAEWAKVNDARVTRVGDVTRKFRIDELPQLFNVLRGDMSFVGPRPERPEFVDQFNDRIPYYDLRHTVHPGITGWAQLCYPYGSSESDTVEKLQYDLYYIKNYSVMFDLMILFQTAHAVLWRRGAR